MRESMDCSDGPTSDNTQEENGSRNTISIVLYGRATASSNNRRRDCHVKPEGARSQSNIMEFASHAGGSIQTVELRISHLKLRSLREW